MKCLMRMFAEEDKGVVFYETVLSIKAQKHTVIECVPLPWDQFELIPGYFKVRKFVCRTSPLTLALTPTSYRNPSSCPKRSGRNTRS